MNSLFIWAMRRAPELLAVAAILVYFSEVITVIAAGQEISSLTQDLLPWSVKARTIVIMFVKPLVPSLLLLFAAAVLWRWDKQLARSSMESTE